MPETCRTLLAGGNDNGRDCHYRAPYRPDPFGEKDLHPAPLGRKISIQAEIVLIEKNVISFQAELWDEMEKIGEATHERAVIEIDRFTERVQKKSIKSSTVNAG